MSHKLTCLHILTGDRDSYPEDGAIVMAWYAYEGRLRSFMARHVLDNGHHRWEDPEPDNGFYRGVLAWEEIVIPVQEVTESSIQMPSPEPPDVLFPQSGWDAG